MNVKLLHEWLTTRRLERRGRHNNTHKYTPKNRIYIAKREILSPFFLFSALAWLILRCFQCFNLKEERDAFLLIDIQSRMVFVTNQASLKNGWWWWCIGLECRKKDGYVYFLYACLLHFDIINFQR